MLDTYYEYNPPSLYSSSYTVHLICDTCGTSFELMQNNYQHCIRKGHIKNYCSRRCSNLAQRRAIEIECANCGKIIQRTPSQIGGKNSFCSSSCAATYNNTHKTHGTRRSKLEKYIEDELSKLYPYLEILYNNKTAINSELDIYIPSFKLAFELNGIYHYEPIHGQNKLDSIQQNDKNKFQLCIENNISLCIIDTSGLKYFKPDNANKYLKIITNILNHQ